MSLDQNAAQSEIRRVCAAAASIGAPQLPLLEAAASGAIGLLLLRNPATPWPTATMRKSTGPTIVLIGDDPDVRDAASLGPDQWSCVRNIRYWQPAGCLIHAAGGKPEHYRMAVTVALQLRRVVVVECSSATAPAWAQALRCRNTMVIIPPNGAPHPVAPARWSAH
jgi:hypothetical protein